MTHRRIPSVQIDRVGIVIPAHNEEALLPACLNALAHARRRFGEHQVQTVVVLDRCTDRSQDLAGCFPAVKFVQVNAGNVGIARAAGVAEVLRWATDTPPSRLWLATTDADSMVPSHWVTHQVELARAGWELVVGTVKVEDWSEQPSSVRRRWVAEYHAVEHHPHVHGANLGCRADAYLEVGGWAPLAIHEDVALVAALAHRRTLRTASMPVVTSARRDPRATGGFGGALLDLATHDRVSSLEGSTFDG